MQLVGWLVDLPMPVCEIGIYWWRAILRGGDQLRGQVRSQSPRLGAADWKREENEGEIGREL